MSPFSSLSLSLAPSPFLFLFFFLCLSLLCTPFCYCAKLKISCVLCVWLLQQQTMLATWPHYVRVYLFTVNISASRKLFQLTANTICSLFCFSFSELGKRTFGRNTEINNVLKGLRSKTKEQFIDWNSYINKAYAPHMSHDKYLCHTILYNSTIKNHTERTYLMAKYRHHHHHDGLRKH